MHEELVRSHVGQAASSSNAYSSSALMQKLEERLVRPAASRNSVCWVNECFEYVFKAPSLSFSTTSAASFAATLLGTTEAQVRRAKPRSRSQTCGHQCAAHAAASSNSQSRRDSVSSKCNYCSSSPCVTCSLHSRSSFQALPCMGSNCQGLPVPRSKPAQYVLEPIVGLALVNTVGEHGSTNLLFQ